jgi:NAD(P)-dependent dehydrogenase (short-subunit alcohol dehydrogenase family)
MAATFEGKVALVTGSTSGIGFATAKALLEGGAVVGINGPSDGEIAAAITRLGSERAVAAAGDIGTVGGCEAAVDGFTAGHCGLDILVNNAGLLIGATIAESDESLWGRVIDVNLKGVFFCSRRALPHLTRAGGCIVNISSVEGLMGAPGGSVYAASKGGVIALTRAMAMEAAPAVRVNCVCPGPIDTEGARRNAYATGEPEIHRQRIAAKTPLGRIADPAEVANVVRFLASAESSFMTGAIVSVDGGRGAGTR